MNITNICLIGLSNSGKTTLLNKIIGKDILPSGKTHVNFYVENTFDEKAINLNLDNYNDNDPRDIINIKTPIVGLYEANKITTKFYDTVCLELEKSNNGRIVQDICMNCDFILYVLNFKDIIRKQIFRHYEILSKNNKKVVLVITHIDKLAHNPLFDNKEKVRKYVFEKYKENNIKLNLCEIIPVNLLDNMKDNFYEILNIVNKTKRDVENIVLRKKVKELDDIRDAENFSNFLGAGISIISSIFKSS